MTIQTGISKVLVRQTQGSELMPVSTQSAYGDTYYKHSDRLSLL